MPDFHLAGPADGGQINWISSRGSGQAQRSRACRTRLPRCRWSFLSEDPCRISYLPSANVLTVMSLSRLLWQCRADPHLCDRRILTSELDRPSNIDPSKGELDAATGRRLESRKPSRGPLYITLSWGKTDAVPALRGRIQPGAMPNSRPMRHRKTFCVSVRGVGTSS